MAGSRDSGLVPRSEALNRLPEPAPGDGETDAAAALYPARSVRKAEVRRTRILPGIDLAQVEEAILRSRDLNRGGRARLLGYARELADFYEQQALEDERRE